MGPLIPYISRTIGNFEILCDAKCNEKLWAFQWLKNIHTFHIWYFAGYTFTHVPRRYLGQIFSWKFFVYRGIRFTITQHLFSTIAVLNLKRSGQYTGYGERKEKKLKALILVLGLLQVVGTVKKLKALILVLGLHQVVGTVKLKAVRLLLGLLQVVGTVKS